LFTISLTMSEPQYTNLIIIPNVAVAKCVILKLLFGRMEQDGG
jgi:hypothetical protein